MTQHLIELLTAPRSSDGESVKMFSQVSFFSFSLSPESVNFYLKLDCGTAVFTATASATAISYASAYLALVRINSTMPQQDMGEEEETAFF